MKKLNLIFAQTAALLAGSLSLSAAAMAAESPRLISQTVAREVRFNDAIPQDANHVKKIVRLSIRLGGNACSAKGMQAIVEARREGRTLNLYPRAVRSLSDEPEVCTTEWRPVYTNYEFEVTSRIGHYDEILVRDVESTDGSLTTVGLN
jgi:hypothetical protein